MEPPDRKPKSPTMPGRRASGVEYLKYTLRRFAADQCPQRAAALTYTTLLALVPLVAVSFAVFAAFPAFEGMREQVHKFVFENFVPQVGAVVQQHLEDFARKTGRLTAVGVIFLVVTSVMLLSAISGTFNAIWRARPARTLLVRLPIYWFVLTAAPMLLGAGMSLSGYLFTVARASGVEEYTGPLVRLAGLLPAIFEVAGLSLLYFFVPNTPVRWRDAVIGGITASLLLEILKKGFGLYVTSFPTYQTIYGALATFPIFLLWMYVVWIVVLFGAEMTAALPDWRAGATRRRTGPTAPAERLGAAAAILAALLAASHRGGGLGRRRLTRAVRLLPEAMTEAMETLRRRRYIAQTEKGEWILARDLDAVTLAQLAEDLDLSLLSAGRAAAGQPWGNRFAEAVAQAEAAGRNAMDRPLKAILSVSDEEALDLAGDDATDDEDGDEDGADGEPPGSTKSRLLAWLGLAWLGAR